MNKNLSKLYSDSKTIVFIDESIEENNNGNFHYVLGFTLIDSRHLESLRQKADERFTGGWYHASGKNRNNNSIDKGSKYSANERMAELIQNALKDGKVRAGTTIYTAPQINSKGQKRVFVRDAREACIKKLVEILKDERGLALIFEEVRGHIAKNKCTCDNCLDKALLQQLNRGRTSRDKIRYMHISPAHEHLLWLPDAIAYLTRRYRNWGTPEDIKIYKIFGELCHIYEAN